MNETNFYLTATGYDLMREILKNLVMWLENLTGLICVCGRQFTWTNMRANPSFAKLDTIFFSSELDDKFPNIVQNGLASPAIRS